MNIFDSKRLAALVGGEAVNSGGNVFIVEVRNAERGAVLCLGDGGWWVEDHDGEHVYSMSDVDGTLVRDRRAEGG